PPARVLHAPAQSQQLAVRARFADGSSRDVTRLTVFSSSDPAIAQVDASGYVEFQQVGEVAILCRYLDQMTSVRLMHLKPPERFSCPHPPENNSVDGYVFPKLKQLSMPPAELCTDSEFIRRVYLDVCGILPAPEETRAFLASRAPDKRARLIET